MIDPLQVLIEEYRRVKDPQYALLVTGPWGSGKTFQVKKVLGNSGAYVKLYGLTSASEIHAEVLAAVDPEAKRVQKALKGFNKIAKAGGAAFAGASTIVEEVGLSILRRSLTTEKVLVFDDLERAAIKDVDILLGAINHYVEELGFHVIIIAHKDKLGDKSQLTEAFEARIEKSIGRIFRVQPMIAEAYTTFLHEIEDRNAALWIDKHKDRILELFTASKKENLRLLKYVLLDLQSLFLSLDHRHSAHDEVSDQLVSLLVSLGLEEKAGSCSNDLIEAVCSRSTKSRLSWARARNDLSPELKNLDYFLQRYPSLYSAHEHLNAKLWNQIIKQGVFDKGEIQCQLNMGAVFAEAKVRKPWEVLWDRHYYDDNILESALTDAWKQIDKGCYLAAGDVLHTFAILISLVDHNIIPGSIVSVQERCEGYLKTIAASGKLDVPDLNMQIFVDYQEDSYGKGFAVSDRSSPEARAAFKFLKQSLREYRHEAAQLAAKDHVEPLLELMKADAKAFYREISLYTEYSRYSGVSILSIIEEDQFIQAFKQLSRSERDTVLYGISARVKYNNLSKEIQADAAWAEKLHTYFVACAKSSEGFRSDRYDRYATILDQVRSPIDDEAAPEEDEKVGG